MNAEFHYYSVYFLCLRAGLGEEHCANIAFASQYVDNAILAYDIDDDGFPYKTEVTQNYIFWDEATLRDIYLPFHFVPGELEKARSERIDEAASRWTVTPDSPLAKEMLIGALRSGDDFRIGIALHAFADTWAHQHFSGRTEACNVVDPASPLPPAGHLQALRAPDDAAGMWFDPRLAGPRAAGGLANVDNGARFREAARKIYRYLRTYLRSGFEDEDLHLDELSAAWARYPGDLKARIASFSVDLDVPPYEKRSYLAQAGIVDEEAEDSRFSSGYDTIAWAKATIGHRTGIGSSGGRIATHGQFRGSAIHRWNEAARTHRALASVLLSKEGLI
jgi:hypothetical protein